MSRESEKGRVYVCVCECEGERLKRKRESERNREREREIEREREKIFFGILLFVALLPMEPRQVQPLLKSLAFHHKTSQM